MSRASTPGSSFSPSQLSPMKSALAGPPRQSKCTRRRASISIPLRFQQRRGGMRRTATGPPYGRGWGLGIQGTVRLQGSWSLLQRRQARHLFSVLSYELFLLFVDSGFGFWRLRKLQIAAQASGRLQVRVLLGKCSFHFGELMLPRVHFYPR